MRGSRYVAFLLVMLSSIVSYAGPLKFAQGQKWTMLETMKMSGQVNENRMEYSVEKVFADGAALVAWKPVGRSGSPMYLLLDSDGAVFPLKSGGPQFDSPEEQAAAVAMGMGGAGSDDVATLKKAKSSASWRKGKQPMDRWVDGKRSKEEVIDGVKCAVYEASEGPINKTAWIDTVKGVLVKRRTLQGKDVEIVATLVK